jgi:thiol-disulfide isomerase/thioredoxin
MLKIALVLGVLSPLTALAADQDRLNVGEEAPSFRLKSMNADTTKIPAFALDDYVGSDAEDPQKKKAVVLSFFASYCEPCKRELPFLSALYKEYAGKGLMVASVSIDKDDESIKKVQDLLAQVKPEHVVTNDHFQVVAKRYYVKTLPALYIVDPAKNVSVAKVGYGEGATQEIFAAVRKSLGIAETEPVPASLTKFLQAAPAKNSTTPATGKRKGHKKPA